MLQDGYKSLLDRGITVHAAVRDPSDKQKTKHIEKIASHGNLKFFKQTSLTKEVMKRPWKGVRLCFILPHLSLDITDPQKQLIDPANLEQKRARASLSIAHRRRVVVTSSVAAIYGDNKDLELTEVAFSPKSIGIKRQAYTTRMPTRRLWPKRSLGDISCTMGPHSNQSIACFGTWDKPTRKFSSFTIMKQLGDGTLKAGVPKWGMGVVDVRDVGEAHVLAALNPRASAIHSVGTQHIFSRIGQNFGKSLRKKLPNTKVDNT